MHRTHNSPCYADESAGRGGVQCCPTLVITSFNVSSMLHNELHHRQVVIDTRLQYITTQHALSRPPTTLYFHTLLSDTVLRHRTRLTASPQVR